MTNQNNKGPAAEAGQLGFAITRLPSAAHGQLPLSKKALRSRIESLSNSMPGINLADSFIGSVGEYDLVWAVQLLDGFSMPLTLTLFKQYMRRRKGGTAKKARTANIWLVSGSGGFVPLYRRSRSMPNTCAMTKAASG